jgi:hypothetical protein
MDPKYFDEAAKYLGKQVLDPGHNTRQALILSDASHLHKFTLGSINRNVNPDWKLEMKKELKTLHVKKERTTFVACIDVRYIKGALEDPEAAQDFKAIILDGQHRICSLRELVSEDASFKDYEFWVVLYIIQNDEEMEQLLKDLDKRIAFNLDDIVTIDVRMRFIKAFKELTVGQESRRCITGTINHNVLRDSDVLNEIKKFNKSEIKALILKSAEQYKSKFEMAKLHKGALLDTIMKTNLYNLIDWQSGSWIREMFMNPSPSVQSSGSNP